MTKVYKIIFITLLFLAVSHTGLAYQLAYLPPGQPITFTEIDNIIYMLANFLIVSSVLLAIIFIVWGGITYMSAGADATKVTEAQTRIKNGVIGAAVVLGVGVIMQTIAGIVSRDFFGPPCMVNLFGVCVF